MFDRNIYIRIFFIINYLLYTTLNISYSNISTSNIKSNADDAIIKTQDTKKESSLVGHKNKSNDFTLEGNIYYRKNNTDEAIIYIHGRNDNLRSILNLNINSDLYCIMSNNIMKKKDNSIYHKRNWFNNYLPIKLLGPLGANKMLEIINHGNNCLWDTMYNDLVEEIEINLLPLVDALLEKVKEYKTIKIVGFSQGGMAANILANKLNQLGRKVDFVISIGSFMVQKTDIRTLIINHLNDELISWDICLGSMQKFNSNAEIIKVSNDLSHSQWPWSNNCIEDLCNASVYITSEEVQKILEKYDYEYLDESNLDIKINYGIPYYLVGIIYYLTYLPATIINIFI